MSGYIYKITCTKNNMAYVGSTNNPDRRFLQHKRNLNSRSHKCKPLQLDWNEHEESTFRFEVIQEVSQEEMAAIEMYYIQEYKESGLCYNSELRGGPNRGAGRKPLPKPFQAAKGNYLQWAVKSAYLNWYAF